MEGGKKMDEFLYCDRSLAVVHRVHSHLRETDFPIHIHADYELYCFVSGKAHYTVEGRVWPLSSGTVLLMQPGESHRLMLDGDETYERYVLNFSPEAIPAEWREDLTEYFRLPPDKRIYFPPSSFEGVTPLSLFQSFCKGESIGKGMACTLLCSLLALLKSSGAKHLVKPKGDAIEMVDYINRHLFEPLDVAGIAAAFHVSVAQAERIFKSSTGVPLGRYIKTKRLLRARESILEGTTAETAARNCGFADYSSFYRLYKKQFGFAPSDKRQLNK